MPTDPDTASTILRNNSLRSPCEAVHAERERASLRPARPGLTTPSHPDTHHPPQHSRTTLVTPAKTTLTPVPPQEPQGHRYRRPRASFSSYGFPQGTHPTPASPPRTGRDNIVPHQRRPTQRIDRAGSQTPAPRPRGTLPRRPDHRKMATPHGSSPRSAEPWTAPPRPSPHNAHVAPIEPPTRHTTPP